MSQTIYKRIKIIDDLKGELNELKDSMEDGLLNDPEYQEAIEKIDAMKEEIKIFRDQVKNKVLSKPTFTKLQEEMKEKREEIKANQEVLSYELVDYYKETGSVEFEDEEGNIKKLKFNVRLVN